MDEMEIIVMNQIGNVVVTNTKRRLLVSCLTVIIGIPIMGCCLFLFITNLLPALNLYSAQSGDDTTLIILMLILGFLVIATLIAIPIVIFLYTTRKRALYLDKIFTPLGLKGEMYLIYGRHYWGQLGCREVDVYIYRGPTLEVRMSTSGTTRFQVMPKGSLPVAVAGIFNKEAMPAPVPELEPYSIYPLDEAWTRSLLQNSRAVAAILTLMTKSLDWALFRHVEVQPGNVLLFINRSRQLFSNLSQLNEVRPWLSALNDLAEAVDAQPQPQITAQPIRSTSRVSRQKRSQWTTYIILFIIIGMPLCFIALGVLIYLLITILTSSGGM
jgi:hypothetical protein